MAKEYKVGEKYYLPVTVKENDTDHRYPITLEFVDCESRNTTDSANIADEPDLLLTAEDIAMVINTERDDALAELKSRNAELEALLKEVMATRDEAIRQNNALVEENDKLKTERDQRNKDFWAMKKDRDELDSIGGKLREENEKWKAKYDNLLAINREQGLRIADLEKKASELENENTNLTFLLEDAPEKEVTKTLHVTLNDGTEIEFRRYTAYDYRTDIEMFVVKDGEKYIAGFMRGDKPTNIAYWWTE